jgi:hypothetical protein
MKKFTIWKINKDKDNIKATLVIKEETIQIMARGGDKMQDHPTDRISMRIITRILLNKIKIQSWRIP